MDWNTEKCDDDLFYEIIEFDGGERDDKDNETHKKIKAKKVQMNKLKLFMAADEEKLVICIAHLLESDVVKVSQKRRLNKLAVPCIFPQIQCSNYEVLSLQEPQAPDHISFVFTNHVNEDLDFGVPNDSIMSHNSNSSVDNDDLDSIAFVEEMDGEAEKSRFNAELYAHR
ncbi:hypothetical protein HA402_014538 [Bradysia odoriphaga]|nr:hypothetical protein HA402_014538 [Bradysia odoriphaga]